MYGKKKWKRRGEKGLRCGKVAVCELELYDKLDYVVRYNQFSANRRLNLYGDLTGSCFPKQLPEFSFIAIALFQEHDQTSRNVPREILVELTPLLDNAMIVHPMRTITLKMCAATLKENVSQFE